MALKKVKNKSTWWINIENPKSLDIDFLRKNFSFHPLDLKDCKIDGQRPKLSEYSQYLFMVFLFPVYNKKTREIEPAEVDFFVGEDFIISVHNNNLPGLKKLFAMVERDKRASQEFLNQGPVHLLYEILNRLLINCYPMLDHLSRDIHALERGIFSGKEKKMVEEILIARRNITDFRKIMQAHKNTLKKLIEALKVKKFLGFGQQQTYFNWLIEHTKDIWDQLESFKEAIEALHQTNESLLSFRLNMIMKSFTTVSVLIFSMTLVATLFAVRAESTPLLDLSGAFWIIIVLEMIVAYLMYQFFKRKKWL